MSGSVRRPTRSRVPGPGHGDFLDTAAGWSRSSSPPARAPVASMGEAPGPVPFNPYIPRRPFLAREPDLARASPRASYRTHAGLAENRAPGDRGGIAPVFSTTSRRSWSARRRPATNPSMAQPGPAIRSCGREGLRLPGGEFLLSGGFIGRRAR